MRPCAFHYNLGQGFSVKHYFPLHAMLVCLLSLAGAETVCAQAEPRMQESTELKLPPMAPVAPTADDGTITTPSFQLPFSYYASAQARDAFVKSMKMNAAVAAAQGAQRDAPKDLLALRRLVAPLQEASAKKAAQAYPYQSEKVRIAGVAVEIFTPSSGIARENRDRILINIHGGGGFLGGGGVGGVIESAPIAHYGHIKVVAIDYRMAPEFTFPAASEDVAAVYKELLKSHRPENMGLYGCSSGGFITAEMVAWFQHVGLPQPGALGVLCASLLPDSQGDSAYLSAYFSGGVLPSQQVAEILDGPSMRGVDRHNSLAVPLASEEVLRTFPPTLFLTGTRAPEMSAATHSHIRLLELGVAAELVLFDGMGHGFYMNPDLPESERADKIIVRFFADHLGRKPTRRVPIGS
jgi:monoterpene epsilon-lactone hydrolase